MNPSSPHITATLLILITISAMAGCGTPGHDMAESRDRRAITPDTLSLDTLKNRVRLTEPDTQHIDSRVYGDTVRAIVYDSQEAVLIEGHFSNGCTRLRNVSYSPAGDTLNVLLQGWQPRDKMCTQALVPFQYVDTTRSAEWLSQFSAYKFPAP